MRYCSAYAARALTFFTIVILYSHSFTPVLAQATGSSSESSTALSSVSNLQHQSSSTTPGSSVGLATSSSHTPSTGSVPLSAKSSAPPTQSSEPASTSSSPASSSPSPNSDTNAVSSTSTPSSSQGVPSATSSSSAPLTSSSSPSSVATSSASSSSGTVISLASEGVSSAHSGATVTAANTPPAGQTTSLPTSPNQNQLPSSSAIGAAAETGISSASSKSFFDNKGAVAGTFTVVALLGVGAVAAIVMYVMRRRHRFDDEEEAAYFEKIPDANDFSNSSSFLGGSPRTTVPTTAAGTSAYPDRTTHYGTSANGDTMDDPQVYPMDYPPGTALARAATQRGAYQYTGQLGGVDYGYPPQPAALGSHPFADPVNVQQPGGAPPVTFQGAEYVMDTPYDDAVYTGVAQ
ncbi:hypothetical protein CERSUDRAFT_111494 [Gelatoporia subvermispora B]|uniref:Transmembrane protein n=1 Tax=Ceriporiopsis subvermispora (strain B) TaxID=914234 RepID=M2QV05_CERS8|nr:hypothetical protein CERSUDRAFT_111494 [Gelatoporia subvermispora B]